MDVVVFGAGSLGSLVGGLCAREHDVTLVGRDPHISAVRESGLRVTGAVEFTVEPDARTTVPDRADLALVTVKSFDTPTAARALTDCAPAVVCSLQNGLGNEERLARSHDTVLAGTCTYGARLDGPGRVACTGIGEVVVGDPDGGPSAAAERVGGALRAANIDVQVSPRMARRRWEKLAVNAGINPVTALAGVANGALADGPLHGVATAAARETARVARENDIDLDERDAVATLESVVETTAENHSSMLQDVRADNRTEVDAINGAVVARTDEPAPVNRTLARLVRGLTA
ncbi:ketopantoate reductase family protein [Halococcus hamelinensis]|uniref:2-dehydropantoate 2-reductase n=1 Tax=Halococcus hamelinensis 100A6 TaxID=1132509 RepID=M0M5A3_9EURY|nr:ketopantoate reductase family protein [Halococcus hamelinensis]EMA40987.1 2-dehydropantoate 2-reductase [Halococcus hamelinensis 100A6]